jgi:kynurenine formamidase
MEIQFKWNDKIYNCDLNQGIDLSIPYKEDFSQVNCFYAPFFSSQVFKMGTFIGSVKEGGPVNYFNTLINIHGNGTHTECNGHISLERESVNSIFHDFFGITILLSVYPTKTESGDRIITADTLSLLWREEITSEFLIIRSLPNPIDKLNIHYSGTNPPYFSEDAIQYIVTKGVKHLLVDLPSVDREEDGGALIAHKTFWKGQRSKDCTITELIYIPDNLKDGIYFLNLQMASIEQDASPSRPVLFRINE